MTGTEDHVTWIGTLVGGIVGGIMFGAAWVKKFVSRGIDSEALKQLKAVEKKNDEVHHDHEHRIRALEVETGRQGGTLEQISKRLDEILLILRGNKSRT